MLLEAEREQLTAVGRHLAETGLVVGTSGNLSARVGDLVAVTPTGAALGALRPADCPVIDRHTGAVVEGEFAPTSEVPLHLAIYQSTDAGAVAHAHALASTALGCVHDGIPMIHYTMLTLGGELRVAPYATYGTPELAENVVSALDGRVAALMRNHGSIAYGATLAEAASRLELTEWLAELYSRALTLGTPETIQGKALDAVREKLSTYGRPQRREAR